MSELGERRQLADYLQAQASNSHFHSDRVRLLRVAELLTNVGEPVEVTVGVAEISDDVLMDECRKRGLLVDPVTNVGSVPVSKFEAYTDAVLSDIASAFGIPYEQLVIKVGAARETADAAAADQAPSDIVATEQQSVPADTAAVHQQETSAEPSQANPNPEPA